MEIYTLDCEHLHPKIKLVEIASSLRIPGIHIVGPTSKEKVDAQHRVRLATENSGIRIPKRQITIQIPCYRLKKYLDGYDLSVCLSLYSHSKKCKTPGRILAWGKVSISGRVESAEYFPKIRQILEQNQITHLVCSSSDLKNKRIEKASSKTHLIGLNTFKDLEKSWEGFL